MGYQLRYAAVLKRGLTPTPIPEDPDTAELLY